MGPLLVTCPRTGKEISTGIETDHASLKDLWQLLIRVQCSNCGEEHEIAVREAYVAGVPDSVFGAMSAGSACPAGGNK